MFSDSRLADVDAAAVHLGASLDQLLLSLSSQAPKEVCKVVNDIDELINHAI
jgi:hypothetical protein